METTMLKVVMFHDMLDGCDDDLQDLIIEHLHNSVSFGDAEYTIIKWYQAEKLFYAALYDSGMTQEEASKFMARYGEVVGTDVAISG